MIPDDVREKLIFLLQRAWVNADWREDAEVVLDWLNALPEPPRPNWDDAPSWAMWWACNADLLSKWHEDEPYIAPLGSWHNAGKELEIERVMIPLHVDWRTLIQKRPDPTEKESRHGL